MTPSDWEAAPRIADNLGTIALLVLMVWGLMRGWVISRDRLVDWQEYARREQERADRLQTALTEATRDLGRLADAVASLEQTIRSERR